MGKGCLILISGSSGVGKSTVIDKLIENNENYNFMCSFTTRQHKRENEKAGKNYIFLSREEFEEKIKNGEVLEWDEIHGNLMGTSVNSVKLIKEENAVMLKDVTLAGVLNLSKILKDEVSVGSVFLTAPKKVLKDRLIKRKEPEIKRRLSIYDKEQKNAYLYSYIIENLDLEDTCNKMQAVIKTVQKNELLEPVKFKKKYSKFLINWYVKLLNRNIKLKPIKVVYVNGKIKILSGKYKYIASVLQNKNIAKFFVNNKKVNVASNTYKEVWLNVLKKEL